MTKDEIIYSDDSQGGMFAVIPAVVMADPALPMSAKMLYGIITWKCNKKSFCWATNRALGEELQLSAKRISALLSILEENHHIETEIIRDEQTGQILRRNIYPIVKSSRGLYPPPENGDTPIPKNEDTPPQNQGDPIPKNEEEKYKEESKKESTPLKSPQGEKRGRKRKPPRAAPDWKPERFAGFWKYYPRGEGKQAAMDAWDKLQPSDELIDRIAAALLKQVKSDQWIRDGGRYIPYASTYLNQRRWEDEKIPLDPGAAPPPTRVVETQKVVMV